MADKEHVSLSGNIPYICSMVEKQKHRTVIFYKDYFEKFFVRQRAKVQHKIIWTFDLIEEFQRVPEIYSRKLKIQMVFMKSGFSQEVIYFEFFVF